MFPKLNRIAHAVFCEPWAIVPSQHAVISRIVSAHMSGEAHAAGGCAMQYDDKPPQEEDKPAYRIDNGVAIIPVHGVIGMRVGAFEKSSGTTDLLDLQNALDMASSDETVEAILLAFDSPGGTVTGTPETAAMIAAIAERMPVGAFTDAGMNSAAYWLASQADIIVASPSASVGCIGVYCALLDSSGWFAQNGLKMELFATGKYKGMGLDGLPLTDDQRAYLQKSVGDIFTQFKSDVSTGRAGNEITAETMQGQSFSAAEGRTLGLVDEVGTLSEAVTMLREYAESRKEQDNE